MHDHLTNKTYVVDVKAKTSEEDAKVKAHWEKVDAQLCSLYGVLLISN